ncbi:hypothetical protein SANA_13710 [Gottschalkiaceae bacterium SANA]|nr:hypothetical protein SANA_13710 [Gottschalkiaceae bacterium SANA]
MEEFKEKIKRIKPDRIIVQTPEEGKLKDTLGIAAARVKEIEKRLR